jgi:RimJ/RimL family protein N-acetyltransferase
MLRDGRVVSVRPVVADDTDRLLAFYAGLSEDARRFRFFSHWRVDRATAARFADVDDDVTGGLVVVEGSADDSPIIGDARWTDGHSGVAEMAMAITDGYQGAGLGRFLLAELCVAARAHGIDTFTASVLADNSRMARLLRSWGFAIVGHDDTDVVHLAMSTSGPVPSWWPEGDGARVLIEGRGWLGRLDEQELRERGYRVAICPGPRQHGASGGCPMLEAKRCPLVDTADVVVFALPLDVGHSRALLHEHQRGDGPPLCVEMPTGHPADGVHIDRRHPVTSTKPAVVVEAVETALLSSALNRPAP